MPIDNVQSGEIFTVRVYKQYVGFSWANTYEVQASSEPINSITAIESVASSIVSLEQQLHISGVIVDRVVISTYVQDGQPYNPSSFTTIPVSLPGQRFPYTDVLPLEMALFVRRNSPTGRDGRLLYRGCLLEGDMSASAFRPLITQNAVNEFQSILATWFNTTFPSQQWNMVMASGSPGSLSVRQITGFQVSERMVVKKLNNRYYDRP